MNKWTAQDLFGPLRSSLSEEQEAYERMLKELSSSKPSIDIWNIEDKNMNDIEISYCDICYEKAQVKRKYYYYEIDCECCGSPHGHFEIVKYCNKCEPKPPKWVTVKKQPVFWT